MNRTHHARCVLMKSLHDMILPDAQKEPDHEAELLQPDESLCFEGNASRDRRQRDRRVAHELLYMRAEEAATAQQDCLRLLDVRHLCQVLKSINSGNGINASSPSKRAKFWLFGVGDAWQKGICTNQRRDLNYEEIYPQTTKTNATVPSF